MDDKENVLDEIEMSPEMEQELSNGKEGDEQE